MKDKLCPRKRYYFHVNLGSAKSPEPAPTLYCLHAGVLHRHVSLGWYHVRGFHVLHDADKIGKKYWLLVDKPEKVPPCP